MSKFEEDLLEVGELPAGWKLAVMGDIASVVGGGTPKSSDESNFAENGCSWVTPADLSEFVGTYVKRGRRSLSEKGLKSCSAVMMPKGTVLLSSRAPIGYVAIAANPISTNQGFKSFVCQPDIMPEYVLYWLRFVRPLLEKMGSGTTFLEISGSRARQIPILVSPAAEQMLIVAKLEELLPRVNAVRERLLRVKDIVKRFRQSVLVAACSGRLTEDWRKTNESGNSAEHLLDGILKKRLGRQQMFGVRSSEPTCEPDMEQVSDLADGWTVASLDQLACLVTSGSRGWAKYYSESGPIFIRAQDINKDCLLLTDVARVQPPSGAEGRRTRVEFGDLLITITGANVTKAAQVASEMGDAYVSQHVCLVRPVDSSVSPFLFLWILSPLHGRAKLMKDAYGAGKPGLGLQNIKEMTIALPPLDEQKEIARRVETLFNLADRIQKKVEIELSRTEKMTQAILARAFRGELVPSDAELALRKRSRSEF